MKFASWKTIIIFVGALFAVYLVFGIAPIFSAGERPQPEKPPVGLEQAQELAQFASQAMREGNYKEAIFALHSAAFVLEEGLGLHLPQPQPPMMMPMGPMPQGQGMCPMMPPKAPSVGNPAEDFPTSLERSKARAEEIRKAGGELGDIPDRISRAEEAFKAGNEDEAWEILKAVNEELNRVKRELSQSQR